MTLNIGRDLSYHDMNHSNLLRVMAALGVICNLQVTCPLICIPIRDIVKKVLHIEADAAKDRMISVSIVAAATLFAILFYDHFASVCSLIGSFGTIFNSIILPLVFYHCTVSEPTPIATRIFHLLLFLVAIVSASIGIYTNACMLMDIV